MAIITNLQNWKQEMVSMAASAKKAKEAQEDLQKLQKKLTTAYRDLQIATQKHAAAIHISTEAEKAASIVVAAKEKAVADCTDKLEKAEATFGTLSDALRGMDGTMGKIAASMLERSERQTKAEIKLSAADQVVFDGMKRKIAQIASWAMVEEGVRGASVEAYRGAKYLMQYAVAAQTAQRGSMLVGTTLDEQGKIQTQLARATQEVNKSTGIGIEQSMRVAANLERTLMMSGQRMDTKPLSKLADRIARISDLSGVGADELGSMNTSLATTLQMTPKMFGDADEMIGGAAEKLGLSGAESMQVIQDSMDKLQMGDAKGRTSLIQGLLVTAGMFKQAGVDFGKYVGTLTDSKGTDAMSQAALLASQTNHTMDQILAMQGEAKTDPKAARELMQVEADAAQKMTGTNLKDLSKSIAEAMDSHSTMSAAGREDAFHKKAIFEATVDSINSTQGGGLKYSADQLLDLPQALQDVNKVNLPDNLQMAGVDARQRANQTPEQMAAAKEAKIGQEITGKWSDSFFASFEDKVEHTVADLQVFDDAIRGLIEPMGHLMEAAGLKGLVGGGGSSAVKTVAETLITKAAIPALRGVGRMVSQGGKAMGMGGMEIGTELTAGGLAGAAIPGALIGAPIGYVADKMTPGQMLDVITAGGSHIGGIDKGIDKLTGNKTIGEHIWDAESSMLRPQSMQMTPDEMRDLDARRARVSMVHGHMSPAMLADVADTATATHDTIKAVHREIKQMPIADDPTTGSSNQIAAGALDDLVQVGGQHLSATGMNNRILSEILEELQMSRMSGTHTMTRT